MNSNLQAKLNDIFNQSSQLKSGNLASYIPELSLVDPSLFSLCLTDLNGKQIFFGDHQAEFTLQSTSKPFIYSLALEKLGEELILKHIGVEPSGEAFDSIIELEKQTHRPYNPMINSGAIAIANLLGSYFKLEGSAQIKNLLSAFANRSLNVNESVFKSEQSTANRNWAIAYLLKNFNIIDYDIEAGLDLYFEQCSYSVNVKDLSVMAATLANCGRNPVSQTQIISKHSTQRTLSLMMTCGMYDTAGLWAYNVGVPAKSGVSGAVFAAIPGKYGIAAFSPLINKHGHSIRGYDVIEKIVQALELSVFTVRDQNE